MSSQSPSFPFYPVCRGCRSLLSLTMWGRDPPHRIVSILHSAWRFDFCARTSLSQLYGAGRRNVLAPFFVQTPLSWAVPFFPQQYNRTLSVGNLKTFLFFVHRILSSSHYIVANLDVLYPPYRFGPPFSLPAIGTPLCPPIKSTQPSRRYACPVSNPPPLLPPPFLRFLPFPASKGLILMRTLTITSL